MMNTTQSETQTDRNRSGDLRVRIDSRDIWNDRRLIDSLEATYQISFDRPAAGEASRF